MVCWLHHRKYWLIGLDHNCVWRKEWFQASSSMGQFQKCKRPVYLNKIEQMKANYQMQTKPRRLDIRNSTIIVIIAWLQSFRSFRACANRCGCSIGCTCCCRLSCYFQLRHVGEIKTVRTNKQTDDDDEHEWRNVIFFSCIRKICRNPEHKTRIYNKENTLRAWQEVLKRFTI